MSQYVWGDQKTQLFFDLKPETVLNAIDQIGFKTTGRLLTLNSMENRVYEIEIDRPENEIESPSDQFLVAKFYRPGRWGAKQIKDEHQFLIDLVEAEVPVVAPLERDGETLFQLEDTGIYFCVFPKKGGRLLQEFSLEQLEILGRLLARLHMVGKSKKSEHRIQITPDSFGQQNLNFLMDQKLIPPTFENNFKQACDKLIQLITPMFQNIENQRIHGDCHLGNIIWRGDENPFLVDFDDMLMGPPVQDIWLVVPGIDQESVQNRLILLEAYESMNTFNYASLKLIEPLRCLRYIHFAAWIGKRWEDPAFQRSFPNYGTERYWQEQVHDIYEQIRKIEVIQ